MTLLQRGPDGTSKHACSECGIGFWFASRKPVEGWRCWYCQTAEKARKMRDDYAAAMDERGAHQIEVEQHEREAS